MRPKRVDEEITTATLHNIWMSGSDTGILVEGGKIIADRITARGVRRPIVIKGGRGHRITNVDVQ